MSESKSSRTLSMQIAADITTMLGHASCELSNQRKFHLGRVIQSHFSHFRPLCAKNTIKPTKMLLGEYVTQPMKDLHVKNKIRFKDVQRWREAYDFVSRADYQPISPVFTEAWQNNHPLEICFVKTTPNNKECGQCKRPFPYFQKQT